MRISIITILCTIIVLALIASVPYYVSESALWWLEGGLVAVAVLLIIINRSSVRRMKMLDTGMALLKEQDFGSRLRKVGNTETDRIVEIFNAMLNQLKNERLRVREQNQLLDLIVEVSPAGIVIFDTSGHITAMNKAAAAILGTCNVTGRQLSDIPGEVAKRTASLGRGESATVRLSDGKIVRSTILSFVDRGFQRRFAVLEVLTDEVMDAEREAYGKVIRTISHEVNNTLAGIIPVLSTVAATTDESLMQEAASCSADRCESLCKFVAGYAEIVKLPDPVLADCNLGSFVLSVSTFLESMCSQHSISLQTEISDSVVMVRADTVLLERVLVNLVKNSIESIRCDGVITLKVNANPPTLIIEDNGEGISGEAIGKIFTPFFSTKAGSRGIGLTLVAEILRRHDCRYRLGTDSDGKTRFDIVFPANVMSGFE